MSIEELFGTLQDSITKEWRDHLKTNKYSKHMALDEFYKEMPEKVDALIEAWQADNDPVEDYKNILDDGMDALEYLKTLKKICKDGRKELLAGESELESLMDDILALIDSTIYKVEKLNENMIHLSEYLKESLLAEGRHCIDCASAELKDLLSKADLQDLAIVQTRTGFKLDSDNPTWKRLLAKNKFNQIDKDASADMTPEEWFKAIEDILATIN